VTQSAPALARLWDHRAPLQPAACGANSMIERDESRLIAQEDKNRGARARSMAAHDARRPMRGPGRSGRAAAARPAAKGYAQDDRTSG